MRNRLVVALVGMTFAVVLLYGLPRAFFLADLVEDQERSRLQHSADLVAVALAEREASGGTVDEGLLSDLVADGEGLQLTPEAGAPLMVGTPGGGDGDVVEGRTVPDVGRFELVRSGDQVGGMVSDAIAPLIVIGAGLLLLSAGVGYLLARRLSRPFQELSTAAERLGRGRFDGAVPHYDVPEAEAIGGALRTAGERLDVLVGRERDFAVNASHQLLTPLAGLRLELEDLSRWPQTPPDVAEHLTASLTDVDRLAAAVGELLGSERAGHDGRTQGVDLAAITLEVAERWRPHVKAGDRDLDHTPGGAMEADVAPEAVVAILDVLIDNALRHGAGRITLETTELPSHLQIRVVDEGKRSVASDVLHRPRGDNPAAGRGLARAAELAESVGGYLRVDDAEHTTMVLMLPRSERG